ncbi:MAG: oligosaccharide flippase family protein [Acidobacteriales bacterium]|nr:oligosaccharide flippase family protein [Terriglobales bacterium]
MGGLFVRINRGWAAISAELQLSGKPAGATVRQRFVQGTLWCLVGVVGTQTFTLLTSLFIARVLGKEAFGQFSFLQGTVATAATFAGFGLGLTATRYVASYRQDDAQRTGSFIKFVMTFTSVTSALASVTMAGGAPYLAAHVFQLPELAGSIRWAALYLLCVTVNGVQTGVLAGFENFRGVAGVNITRGVATLLLSTPLVLFWRLDGAVAAMALAGVLAYGVSQFQVEAAMKVHGIPKAGFLDWSHAKVLWKFSLPAVLSGVMVSPVTWLVSLWLSRQPNGYGELGLFGAANQWRSAVSLIPGILSQPILPLLTSLGSRRMRSFNRLVIFSATVNAATASAVGALVILAIPVLSVLYGKSFAGLNVVLIPLMAAGVISCAATAVGNALASQERMWVGFILNLIWACCLLMLASAAIPVAGARGLAYSFLAAYLLHMLTTGYSALCDGSVTASGRIQETGEG